MNRITPPTSPRAFTLVELMISIAIVVVLMVGITKVFSLTASTAGATNTVGAAIRDARAAQATFYNDLGNAASNMPFMILRCAPQPAFRNKADQQGDRNGVVTDVDLNGDNIEGNSPGETYGPTSVNNRVHRVDVLSFFANGLFPRQTGGSAANPNQYLADMSSQEAWIWYGHLRLLNNAGTTYFDPGDTSTSSGKNDNNQYASDWVLGREAILLKTPDSNGQITDRQGVAQYYVPQTGNFGYGRGTFSASSGSANYTPFHYLSRSSDNNYTMQASRYDLAGTTIGTMAAQVSDYLNWLAVPANDPTHSCTWWNQLMSGDIISNGPPILSSRFQAKTYVTQPIKGADTAYTSPLFVQHCSQFIVEYAGDYLNQNAVGAVVNNYTDGPTDNQIDYVYNPVTLTKSIRWYGFPRDIDGDGHIPGPGSPVATLTQSPDVIPLRDMWLTATMADTTNTKGAPFERTLTGATTSLGFSSDYAQAGVTAIPFSSYYECVWGPSDRKPWMIRITMTIDDPTGKLPDGQTFQYVIALPH